MSNANKILFISSSQVMMQHGSASDAIIEALKKQGLSSEDSLEIIESANNNFREKLSADKCFQVSAPAKDFPNSKGLCSDNSCPCPGTEKLKPDETGYIYISSEVIENRKNALTVMDLEKKSIASVGNSTVPILICKLAAERRNLNLEIALNDAKLWFETGLAPLRETPLNEERDVKITVEKNAPTVSKTSPKYMLICTSLSSDQIDNDWIHLNLALFIGTLSGHKEPLETITLLKDWENTGFSYHVYAELSKSEVPSNSVFDKAKLMIQRIDPNFKFESSKSTIMWMPDQKKITDYVGFCIFYEGDETIKVANN